MDTNVKAVVHECTNASVEQRITFGEVVMTLLEAGIERYHADLVRGETIYYLPDGDTEVVQAHAARVAPPSNEFSAEGVEAAVRAIQAGTIQYRTFCERVLKAGCVGYIVSMVGRRVVYYGRTGDNHVEWFPSAK
jgi:uncharacterized protein YbcV (DUF1398 family)